MNSSLDWRWIVARGVLGIVFGILVLLYPVSALVTVAFLFAFYVALDGALALTAAWNKRHESGTGLLVLEGVVGILAGVAAVIFPGAALLTLVILMGAWALITGVIEIYAAFTLRSRRAASPVLLGLAGIVSLIFGFFVIFRPIAGAFALVTILAIYSLFFGFLLISWGFRLRQHRPLRTAEPQPA